MIYAHIVELSANRMSGRVANVIEAPGDPQPTNSRECYEHIGDPRTTRVNPGDLATFNAVAYAWTFTAPPPPVMSDADKLALLNAAKDVAHKRIDTEAGKQRLIYGTDIPFQDSLYQMKYDEAKRFDADTNPDATPTNYPFLNEEATARTIALRVYDANAAALSVRNMRDIVMGLAQAWTIILSKLDGVRLGKHQQIDGATTIDQINAAFPIGWPGL